MFIKYCQLLIMWGIGWEKFHRIKKLFDQAITEEKNTIRHKTF